MNVTRALLFLLVLLGFSASAVAQQNQVDVWKSYRQQYPYHAQLIAVSPRAADGSRVLIVSEPPPHVTLEAFRAFSPELKDAVVMKQDIGHNGWVKDIVVVLPNLTPDETQGLVTRLNRFLFFTSYKASYIELTLGKTSPQKRGALRTNLQVSVSDLRSIALDKNEFLPLYGGAYESLHTLLTRGQSGVFFSRESGLVAWLVSVKTDLSEYKA